MKRLVFLLFISCFFILSCKEEQEIKPIDTKQLLQYDVIVLNEGNFQWGQGTVSMYNSQTSETIHKVFQANNEQRPLGDVAQSMTFKGDTAFIVVNNSNKIEIINLLTFKSIGQITGLNSPRNMLIVNSEKAYVSDLYENKIYIIHPKSFEIIGKISTDSWTEEMVQVENKVFVCAVEANAVFVIDVQSDQLIKKIPTADSPQSIVADKDNNLWVSCSGGLEGDTAAVHQIDVNTLEVVKSFYAENERITYMDLAVNSTKDKLCLLSNQGIYQFSIQDENLSTEPLIKANGKNFYTLNINPKNDEIYVADALDYQQQGIVYRYNFQAKEKDNFRVGIIPGAIYFK